MSAKDKQVQPRAHDCALARELRFEIALLNAEIGGLKADVERLTRERDDWMVKSRITAKAGAENESERVHND